MLLMNTGEAAFLANIKTAIEGNDYIKICLYKGCTNGFDATDPLDPTMVTADFIEADYQNYAGQNITSWTAIGPDGTGRSYMQASSSLSFQYTGAGGGSGNTIYGYFGKLNTAGTLIFAHKLPATVDIDDSHLDALIILPKLTLGTA